MRFLQRIFCCNFNDEILAHSFLEFSIIYLIQYEEVSLDIYVRLFEKTDILFIYIVIFLQPKIKRPGVIVYILSNFENLGNRYKEVTSPISGYQGHPKSVNLA